MVKLVVLPATVNSAGRIPYVAVFEMKRAMFGPGVIASAAQASTNALYR